MGNGETRKQLSMKQRLAARRHKSHLNGNKPTEAELEQAQAHRPEAIMALPQAPERFEIEAHLRERDSGGGVWRRLSWFLWSFPFLPRIRQDIVHSFASVAENPANPIREVTPAFLDRFTDLAREKGVGAIGYTALPPEAVFHDKGVLFDQVIVLIQEMDFEKMAQAPSRTTFRMVMETYYDLGLVTNDLVNFLRANSYAAQAGHPLNGVALYPLIAQRAGLGWCGSHGLLITPEFGPRQRISVIYTNIQNLPPAGENEHAWIANLCARCGQCQRFCPSSAILAEPITHESGIVTHIDVEKCFPVFADQYGCSLCIKVCPFNLHPYAKIKDRYFRGASTRKSRPAG